MKPSNFRKTKLFHMEPSTVTTTPPKLSFHSIPLHQSEPSGLATPPPFRVPVSIPFMWEEEPGRPRKTSICKPNQKPFSARSLKLPPKMVAEELKVKGGTKNKNCTSPTSVLDVPHSISRSKSFSRCYSFNIANERRHDSREKHARKEGDILSHKKQRKDSNSGGDSLLSSSPFNTSHACDDGKESRVKITRVRHRGLIDVSVHATSHFLVGIYKRLRQVVHWHRT